MKIFYINYSKWERASIINTDFATFTVRWVIFFDRIVSKYFQIFGVASNMDRNVCSEKENFCKHMC